MPFLTGAYCGRQTAARIQTAANSSSPAQRPTGALTDCVRRPNQHALCWNSRGLSDQYDSDKPSCRLDGKHVVFGRVVGDSMLVVRKVENVATGAANKPKIPVMVSECGEL